MAENRSSLETRRPTLIIDIDGTILRHYGRGSTVQWSTECELNPGVREFFDAAEKHGASIVLITARRESNREQVERILKTHGLFWDALVMGVGNGARFLIGDVDSMRRNTNFAINVGRNEGLTYTILGDDL